MISSPTVFVLGAGASIPYGFPSGAALRDELCRPTTQRGHAAWVSILQEACEIPERDSLHFSKKFLASSVESIDAFLSRRMDAFGEIGKLAIAAILCAKETPELWRMTDTSDDWYTALWNALISGVHRIEDIGINQVRFITFNYDRSLEYFLHRSCKETFGCNDARAEDALKNLSIIHVYGALGELGTMLGPNVRPYDNEVRAREINIAANGIKIIPEARDDAFEFEVTRKHFSWASQICFLGFGFDPLNVSRLNLSSVLNERRVRNENPRIVASVYQKTDAERKAITSILCPGTLIEAYNEKSLMTLRESGILL